MFVSNRFPRLVAVVFLAIIGLVLGACAKPTQAPAAPTKAEETKPAAKAPTEIVIGAALPLTGKESKVGNYFKTGYELYIKEVNDKGGIYVKEFDKRIPVRLVIKDDQSNKAQTVALVERLITQDKVHLLLGGYSTTLVQAQAPVANKYGIPYVNGGGAATKIYAQGFKCVFGTLSPISVLAHTEMDWLKTLIDAGKLPKPLKIALLWENTSHGQDYQAGVHEKVKEYEGYFKIVMDESFELHSSDFSSLLDKVAGVNADVMMVDAHLPDYITMHRQYTQKGLKHLMLTYGARGPDAAAREALGEATNGIFAAVWWSPLLPYPQVQDFVKKWKAYAPDKPLQWYSAAPYWTAHALVTAVENAGTLDHGAVCDALRNLKLTKSIIPGQVLTFTKTGQTNAPYVIVQNKPNNKVDIVYPEDAKTGEACVPMQECK